MKIGVYSGVHYSCDGYIIPTMRQIFIDDRYLLGNLLGVGGMARVFMARDRLLNRDVALKILRDQYAENKQFVERFRREAQSAAALSHPNIVSVYDWGRSQDGTYYMAMECVPGGTLKERISSEGPLTLGTAADLGIQIAKALEVAHERGVVHRDVKPQNILLNASGQAKVADFGIARAVGAMATTAISQTGLVMGTVNYISPEQAMSEPVGPQSDLYSLGVVLYEMLTAKVPFEAETLIGVCMKHVNEPPHPPKKLNPRVSDGMEVVVLKLLAKKTNDRYGSAAELAEDLRRVSNGLAPLTAKPVEVHPRVIQIDMQPTVPIPSGSTARSAMARRIRNRARASGILAGFALLALLLGGSDWSLSQNLLRQALGPSPQSEAPQVQEEAQQGTNVEDASTEETAQAEEATNTAPKGTDSSEQAPSTEIATSPALTSTPVANTSNLSAEPVLWSGPAQQPSQPAPEQQPAKEKPAKEKPAKEKPAKEKPAEVQAVASQLQSYGGSSNTQNGDKSQGQRFTEQISGSQKPPHK
jgi:serine/threonine protein kinase